MHQNEPLIIAIDGPSGAGKSTVAREIAKRMGILYLDTGAMYRAIGVAAIENGIDPTDESAVSNMMKTLQLEMLLCEQGSFRVLVNQQDLTDLIRTQQASRAATDVAACPTVRTAMVDMQRQIARGQDVILDGRDIGTTVFPDAKFKFYVSASVEERAKRRHAELLARGESPTMKDVMDAIIQRDHDNATRQVSPERMAEDAVLIDTTGKTIDQVVKQILFIVQQ